jgi:centromere protein J
VIDKKALRELDRIKSKRDILKEKLNKLEEENNRHKMRKDQEELIHKQRKEEQKKMGQRQVEGHTKQKSDFNITSSSRRTTENCQEFGQRKFKTFVKKKVKEVEGMAEDEKEFEELEEEIYQKEHHHQKPQDATEEYLLQFPEEYHDDEKWNNGIKKQIRSKDGKVQTVYESGKIEVVFPHKVTKQIFPDGYTIVYFFNKDIKQNFPDGKLVYFFSEVDTTQTTMPDGLQIFRFASGQVEKHYQGGNKEIIFQDGTIHKISLDGTQIIEGTSGEKEITYPDGSTFIEYPDGTTEKVE